MISRSFFLSCVAGAALAMSTPAYSQFYSPAGDPNRDVIVNWDLIERLGQAPTVPGQIRGQEYEPYSSIQSMPPRPVWRNSQPPSQRQFSYDTGCCRTPPPPPAVEPKSMLNTELLDLLQMRQNQGGLRSPGQFGQELTLPGATEIAEPSPDIRPTEKPSDAAMRGDEGASDIDPLSKETPVAPVKRESLPVTDNTNAVSGAEEQPPLSSESTPESPRNSAENPLPESGNGDATTATPPASDMGQESVETDVSASSPSPAPVEKKSGGFFDRIFSFGEEKPEEQRAAEPAPVGGDKDLPALENIFSDPAPSSLGAPAPESAATSETPAAVSGAPAPASPPSTGSPQNIKPDVKSDASSEAQSPSKSSEDSRALSRLISEPASSDSPTPTQSDVSGEPTTSSESDLSDQAADILDVLSDQEQQAREQRKEQVIAAITPESYKNLPSARRVIFTPESTVLNTDARAQLDAVVRELKENPSSRIQLLAYSGKGEGASSEQQARRFSLSRALEVRSYLLERDVLTTRIDVRPLGNTPAADGLPADRVDILFVPQ